MADVKSADSHYAPRRGGINPAEGVMPNSVEGEALALGGVQPGDVAVARSLLKGLELPKWLGCSILKLFGGVRSTSLASDEVPITASARAQELRDAYDVDVESFARKLSSEKVTSFDLEVLKILIKDPGEGPSAGAVIAGRIFHAMGDVEKQRAVLEQIDNIGVGARLIHWAAYEAKGSSGKDSYQENNLRFSELSLSGNKKLKLMCMTAASTGIDIETKHDCWIAAQVQDRILRLFADYYENANSVNYNFLRKKLERRKGKDKFTQHLVGQPNEEGEIQELGFYFNEPERKSQQNVASSIFDTWRPYGEYIERIRQAEETAEQNPARASYVLHSIGQDLEGKDPLGAAWVWHKAYEHNNEEKEFLERAAEALVRLGSDQAVETYRMLLDHLIRQNCNPVFFDHYRGKIIRGLDRLNYYYGVGSALDLLREIETLLK